MSAPHEPQPWPLLSSRQGPDLVICRARFDRLRNPRTGAAFDRLVLEAPDWVNVIAVTHEREVVLVKQYRFGTGAVALEIPGGVLDPGEDSRAAAERELREESGFTAERWRYLGSVQANPAFLTNTCHHWLAEDARCTERELALDEGEDIAVELVPAADLPAYVADGRIAHSLVVAALARWIDLRA